MEPFQIMVLLGKQIIHNTYIYTHPHIHTYISKCLYIYIYIHMYVYIYIYIDRERAYSILELLSVSLVTWIFICPSIHLSTLSGFRVYIHFTHTRIFIHIACVVNMRTHYNQLGQLDYSSPEPVNPRF